MAQPIKLKIATKQHIQLPPTVLTIFGATGDLAIHYLLPALLHVHAKGMLPQHVRIVCVGRRPFTAKTYVQYLLQQWGKKKTDAVQLRRFVRHIHYYQADFDTPEHFRGLASALEKAATHAGSPHHRQFNRLYYFATAPKFFTQAVTVLQ